MNSLALDREEASLEKLSNSELHSQTLQAAQTEKRATLKLLHHLHEVQKRKLYAEFGYASLWDYSMRALGYSETQTAERISAMRLMSRSEQAKVALESGSLNITQAAMAERHFRAEEKESKAPVSTDAVCSLLEQMEGQTKRETEKLLLSLKSSEGQVQERIRSVTPELSEVKFPMSEETRALMERFWEIRGRCSIADVFSACLTFFLNHKDPVRKEQRSQVFQSQGAETQPNATLPVKFGEDEAEKRGGSSRMNSRYIAASVKRDVRKQSEDRCQYVDPVTQRRCESKYLLQFDHIHPFALGGRSEADNLRMLCRTHNLYLAEKMFAREEVEAYFPSRNITSDNICMATMN